ncbi:unnamed protein product [Caenorhabditis sp. 36 PRJEB53466]|nr:unnamed protein product [Caenorhabditis sp. 36 PRJEB53466]
MVLQSIQTAFQKYIAAPTPCSKRRPMIPSPLIGCPEVGVVYGARFRRAGYCYRFRPDSHLEYERQMADFEVPKKKILKRDMEKIDALLPIDILLRSLQEQAERIPPPPDPIPIRLKMLPQLRRVKCKRYFRKRYVDEPYKRQPLRLPERGQLIARQITIEQILKSAHFGARAANPKMVALMLVTRILQRPPDSARIDASQLIAQRRGLLHREEGLRWLQLFLPGACESNPKIPAAFRMFDHTDEGIPEEIIAKRPQYHQMLNTYQFRVLAKRCACGGNADLEERFLLGEIIGLSEKEVQKHLQDLRTIDEDEDEEEEEEEEEEEDDVEDEKSGEFRETSRPKSPLMTLCED